MTDDEKLNKEYVSLISQMRELNKQRYEIYKKFKVIKPDVQIAYMRTPSLYHDLYNNDLDKI